MLLKPYLKHCAWHLAFPFNKDFEGVARMVRAKGTHPVREVIDRLVLACS